MRSVARRATLVTFISITALTLVDPAAARAQVYTYQGLADTRPASPFADFGTPIINEAGDIAFAARLKNGGSGIYKWSATTRSLVTIFEDPTTNWLDFHNSFGNPALAPDGTVLFQYEHGPIWAGNGNGSLDVVVDEGSTRIPLAAVAGLHPCLEPTLFSRSADANGRAVVRCVIEDGVNARGVGFYLARVGSIERICDQTSGGLPNLFTRCFIDGTIEASGDLVAGIGLDLSRFDQFGLPRQLLLRGNAASLEVLLDPGVDSAVAFPGRLSKLGINEQGTVTYDAFQSTPGASGSVVFRIDTAGVPISRDRPSKLPVPRCTNAFD